VDSGSQILLQIWTRIKADYIIENITVLKYKTANYLKVDQGKNDVFVPFLTTGVKYELF